MDEVGNATWDDLPWNWCRLAHVCRTWRYIIFASSRHLHLELLCTHGTPVKKDLSYLPTFPLFVSFLDFNFSGPDASDRDNLISALEHPDRVQIVDLHVPPSLFEELATVMQEPFPVLTHLRLESQRKVAIPALPDTFLGGSAPRLQEIHLTKIPFPAAPTLLLSAHDLVDVDLHEIPSTGYIPPEAMVASLAVLPRLRILTFGFVWGASYPDRISPPVPPITRTVLPALTLFCFEGLLEYFEDFVAQIDAPQLDSFGIEYRDHQDYRIPQLCKFIERSKKLSGFRRALLLVDPDTIAIDLSHQSSFTLTFQEDAIGPMVSQISATSMLSNVDRLTINSNCERVVGLGNGIRWLELFRPFTAAKALIVDELLSWNVPLALKNVTEERAAEVLPTLELLFLKGEPVASLEVFLAARQNVGRPVTVINEEKEFQERANALDLGE
jgi:hypothetical protein